jgi:hypothetical protein
MVKPVHPRELYKSNGPASKLLGGAENAQSEQFVAGHISADGLVSVFG